MNRSKILKSVMILVLAGLAISGVADNVSEDYAEKAFTRALATFAVARTLNGVISVAQGTEVAIEPGGVGVIMTPGQILDPINDLVERFSSVMLVASSSIGLQIVLLEITSWIGVTTLLLAALAAWLAAIWMGEKVPPRVSAWAARFALMLVFIRFVVPIVIMSTNFMFDTFLQARHDRATAELQGTSQQIQQLNTDYQQQAQAGNEQASETGNGDDESLLDYLQSTYEEFPGFSALGSQFKEAAEDFYSDTADWFSDISVSARMERLRESAGNAASEIVNLIVVFLLQTVIFPVVFLWLFVEALKSLAGRAMMYKKQ